MPASILTNAYPTEFAALKSARSFYRRHGVVTYVSEHNRYNRIGELLQRWYTVATCTHGRSIGELVGSVNTKYTTRIICRA